MNTMIYESFKDNTKIMPIVGATSDGGIDENSTLFLATIYTKQTIRKKLKEVLKNTIFSLEEGVFATRDNKWAGFWVKKV